MYSRRLTALAALAACYVMAPLPAQRAEAARVTPMVLEITPTGTGSVARIEVTNDEDREVPFELTMHRGTISETGEVTLEPADDRFVIFPPQVVLAPRSQQVFRIQFLPDAELSRSEIYYASVSQLPVALDPTETRIQVLMRFNVLLHVVPAGTSPEPVIEWIRPAERELPVPQGQEGETQLQSGIEVRISNNGNRYFGAGETGWTIAGTDASGAAFSETLSDRQVRESTGLGIVAPGQARVFFIPLGRQVNAGSVRINFN